jgi:hypothetical protein
MELNKTHSQKYQFYLVTLFTALSILFFTTCSEDPLRISPDTLPNDGMMDVYVDTIPVELYTVSTDAIVTRSIGVSALGSVNDNVIGNLQTDFFADFIYVEEPSFKDEMDLDSILLIDLKIDFLYNRDKIYGDLEDLDFNVYELLEPMPLYTKSDFFVLPHMFDPESLVEEITYQNNSYTAGTSDVIDTCHITLKNSFAQRFLDTTLIDAEIYHSDNQRLFKEYFKGFYVAVQERSSVGGAIIQIDHSYSRMTLRTKEWNSTDDVWDTISNVFSIGDPSSEIDSGGVHLNIYRNAFKPAIASIINDTVNLHDYAYIQSLSGPQVYIKLPTLEALRDSLGGQASINRAQLILPVEMETYSRNKDIYSAPAMLGLIDGESKIPVLDFSLAQNHLGGKLDTTDTNNRKYILNIENHIHEYCRDESSELSNTFYLFSATIEEDEQGIQYLRYSKFLPEQIVLNGSTSLNPPFVRIVYSKIRE